MKVEIERVYSDFAEKPFYEVRLRVGDNQISARPFTSHVEAFAHAAKLLAAAETIWAF